MPIWQRMMFAHAAVRPPSDSIVAVGDNSSPFLAVYKSAAMTKLTAPATLPSTVVHCTAINRANSHVAVSLEGVSNTANLLIYDTSGAQLVLLNTINLSGLPAKAGLSYSPDGRYLAATSGTAPYLYVYDVQNNYALISPQSGGTPIGAGAAVAWVNERIVVGGLSGTTNNLYVFSIDARPGWSAQGSIGLPLNLAINKMRASRDGRKLAILAGASSVFYWSDIDPITYTFGTGRTLTLASTDDLHFSFDGTRLAVSLSASPFIAQYNSTSLTTWTILSAPASLPAVRPFGVFADPSETGFLVGGSVSNVNAGKILRYSFANVRGTDVPNGPGFGYYGSSEKVN